MPASTSTAVFQPLSQSNSDELSALPPPIIPIPATDVPAYTVSTTESSTGARSRGSIATRLRSLPRLESYSAARRMSSASESGGNSSATDDSDTDTDDDDDDHSPSDPVTITLPPLRTLNSSNRLPGFNAGSIGSGAATPLASAVQTTWATFSPITPTPGPMRTVRAGQGDSAASYFDIRKSPPPTNGNGHSQNGNVTPISQRIPPQIPPISPAPARPTKHAARPTIYSRQTKSLVELSSSLTEDIPPPAEPAAPANGEPSTTSVDASPAPRPRRNSMVELRDPPPYESIPSVNLGPPQAVVAREEEGKEKLPDYTCDVHIEGYYPRKVEFTAPGIQAKDRSWKKRYVILHGTSIKVFRFDPRTAPLPPSDEASQYVLLHSNSSDEGSIGSKSRRSSVSSVRSVESDASYPKAVHVHALDESPQTSLASKLPIPHHNSVVRHYSLQGAESGLAADYLKRRHVIRVRAEGEQFLIQVHDDRSVIDWIEALQAATNTALDLDVRPLPKFITLPRRRRRRRPAENSTTGTASTTTSPTSPAQADANAHARMNDDLADEQANYMGGRAQAGLA